jgi:CheY-like chemotaxis protein
MPKILVIDDEELLIKTLNRLLEKQGYEVYTAKNGTDAGVMAEEEDFDLIISDIRMPGKNGVEVVQAIQKQVLSRQSKALPVIFITGFADPKIEAEAKKLNPAAYLMKPFDVTEILGIIRKTLS